MKLSYFLCVFGLLFLVSTPAVIASSPKPDAEGVATGTSDNAPSVDESEIDLKPPADKHFEDPGTFEGVHFIETFQTDPFESKRWVKSANSKYAAQSVSHSEGAFPNKLIGDMSFLADAPAQHYGVSTKFEKPFVAGNGDTVLQYEVKLEHGLECGGAYLKFVTADEKFLPSELHDKTPFTIMFGPDKCGGTNKVHFILRHQNPVSKEWEEKHMTENPSIASDTNWHLYTLIIRGGDNSFEVLVDGVSKRSGSLLSDMSPPVNPSQEIDDPEDTKPEDWVDEPQMLQPGAVKPEDWDEDAPKEIPDAAAEKPSGWLDDAPDQVPDPSATMPEDWDQEEDGEWEAPIVPNPACDAAPGCGEWTRPMIPNPDYKGKWVHPMVNNPAYKGVWAPRRIPNPHFFTTNHPSRLAPIAGVAFEVWTMQGHIRLDNLLLGSSAPAAALFAQKTFHLKRAAQEEWDAYTRKKNTLTARLLALKEGGVLGTLQFYGGMLLDAVQEHLLVCAALGLLLLVSFFYACSRRSVEENQYHSGSDSDNDNDSDSSSGSEGEGEAGAGDASSDQEGEGKEESKGEQGSSSGLRQRKKRTPKST